MQIYYFQKHTTSDSTKRENSKVISYNNSESKLDQSQDKVCNFFNLFDFTFVQ